MKNIRTAYYIPVILLILLILLILVILVSSVSSVSLVSLVSLASLVWKWVTANSDALQGLGAVANILIVILLFLLGRKDKNKEYRDNQKLRWFMDFILPDFSNSLNYELQFLSNNIDRIICNFGNISVQKNVKRRGASKRRTDSKQRVVQNLIDLLAGIQHNELSIIDKINHYDSVTCEELRDKCDAFYDDLANLVPNMDEFDANDFKDRIAKHKNEIYEILYLKIIKGPNN